MKLSCSVRPDCVQRGSHCSVRTDCVQRGSHCSDSEQSGTSLLRSHGLRSAQFTLFRVVMKWNYLVQFAWTTLSAVCIVQYCNELELFCSVRMDALSAVRILLSPNRVELSSSVRTDCTERGSHCSDSEQSGTILFRAHRLC